MLFRGQIASYRAIEPLLVGPDSAVFRATSEFQCTADQPPDVAIKQATCPRGAHAIARETAILRRVARAGNVHVVALQDAGETDGLPWLATRWLSGGNLDELANEPWSSARITQLVYDLAVGLSQLHALGVVHADICPANIGFDDAGRPVFLDLGAATEIWEARTEGTARRDGSTAPLAEPDLAASLDAGTLGYVAPERLLGRAWDTRADIYSLACVWYQLLTGRPVFASDSEAGVSSQHLRAEPLAPSRLGLSIAPELERVLLRSLAKEPHARTSRASDLAQALAAHAGLPAPNASVDAAIVFRSRLHGRAAAIATIRARMLKAKTGSGGLLVIGGPSGSGKTRLQAAVDDMAAELGLACLSTTAHEAIRELPIVSAERELGCFAETLRRVAVELALTPQPQSVLTELSPLSAFDSELEARLPRVVGEAASDAAFQALVFNAIIAALQVLAKDRPLVLRLDDAQFADDLTLRFLRSDAIRRLQALPVLLVVGWNTSRAELPSAPHTELLQLGPLSAALTGEMLKDMLGTSNPDPALVESVHRASHGTPLAISELVAAAASERRSPRGDGPLHGNSGEISGSLAERVRARVASLPPSVSRVAGLAAVLGDEFSLQELSQIAADQSLGTDETHPLEIGAALEALLVQRVVVPAGPGACRFTHGIYREACEDLLEKSARRDLHRTLAARLVASPAANLLQRRIGLHHAAAGESRACVTPLRRAARAALRVRAIEDASRLLELAWHHARKSATEAALAERAARTGWDLLRVLMRAAEHDRLRAVGRELLGALAAPSLLRSRVQRLLALSYRITGDYSAVSRLLEASSAELQAAGGTLRPAAQRELLEHGIMRVSVHYSLRELAAASAVLRELRPLARAVSGPAQRAKLYMWRANVIALRSRYAFSRRAVEYERRAVAAHARAHLLSAEYVMSQFDLAFMLLLGGPAEWQEAAHLLDEAHTLAEHLNDAVLVCRIVTYRAVAARRAADTSACEDLARVALAGAESSGLRGYVGAAHACLGWAALRRGDDARAEQECAAALVAWNGHVDAPPASNCYPFQWLAFFPLLAARLNCERVDECGPLIRGLLEPSQARLRRSVTAQLTLAAESWPGASERERLDSLDACLRSAAKHRYL